MSKKWNKITFAGMLFMAANLFTVPVLADENIDPDKSEGIVADAVLPGYDLRNPNILATTICSFPFFLPYGGCVLLFLGGVSSMMDTYTFLPKLGAGDMMFTAFYSWASGSSC